MLFRSLLCLAAVFSAEAFYDGNLNYNSPSRRHDYLGISLPKVQKRLADDKKLIVRGASNLNFTHGVASGDPLVDSVILWTRLAPITNVTQTAPICVNYQVSTSKTFSDCIDKGTAYTSSDVDYTVKVEAKGLVPFTTYYYNSNLVMDLSPAWSAEQRPHHSRTLNFRMESNSRSILARITVTSSCLLAKD